MSTKSKMPLRNKTEFQMFCIVISIPANFLLFIFSCFLTVGMMINKDWNFIYGVIAIVLFGLNTKSIMSLMDYPDDEER